MFTTDVNDSDGRPFDTPEDEPREECGVFGVWAPGEEVAKLTYFGLFALQHRGQEGAGIAAGDAQRIVVFKDMGLVSQVFDEPTLEALQGDVAIGHTRYSTAGSTSWENVQPIFRATSANTDLALGHNGNLVNYQELRDEAIARRLIREETIDGQGSSSDSAVMAAFLADAINDETTPLEAARELLPRLEGAFCLVFTDGEKVYAARDRHGVRPLSLGQLDGGWVVASETAALDIVGARFVRDIEPGELIAIDGNGVHSEKFAKPKLAGCVFEYVYLARPDSVINGETINTTRIEIGKRLARADPVDADLVMPVPESGVPAAIGYASACDIPYGRGLMKNAYVGRTFIQPSQTLRKLGIRLKLNPVRAMIDGKRLVVVDDSIVRGNTQIALIRMLREAGAAEVHVRIASPPVKWPCFYGIDFADPDELIANQDGLEGFAAARTASRTEADTVDYICETIGADSLAFVSEEDMIAVTQQPGRELCTACFSGHYPLGLPAGNAQADIVRELQEGTR
ncbi:amidophosphoribosyltransferase [Corynebacterium cystitidis]|uniref:Amidophosphoribosyltransferase n=1 Tax=Corynebacterium cystitidis DSM 20524 TaxID=1121357 RepID=A0A1H9W229_9CORY|nr:amidophosphoribosyltransferase [Corynebacterium cystitidis]WJY82980.1 Amidophosphoribosyltransferase precursor [Corynebacterium cystitidis DSM 20524]SES27727.1 amidophosphoribosyltransferase [Corynebacterium cystitidis DSM 20524]SNV64490.1 amidophosphoribosyltransferase [Corynebacterium cystitidis]